MMCCMYILFLLLVIDAVGIVDAFTIVCISAFIYPLYTRMQAYTCTHAYIHVCMCTRTHMCTHIHTYICTYTCTYVIHAENIYNIKMLRMASLIEIF